MAEGLRMNGNSLIFPVLPVRAERSPLGGVEA